VLWRKASANAAIGRRRGVSAIAVSETPVPYNNESFETKYSADDSLLSASVDDMSYKTVRAIS